jgi:ATP-binding cassette subfamily B protein
LTYESMIIWPIRHMGRVLTDSGKAIVSMGRLSEILLAPIESQNELDPGSRLSGRIEVKNLSFGYEAEKPVLSNLSFTVEPGQTLAIMGPPGSGKSTLTQLLMRLYDYQDGSITLGDLELASLSRKYVRAQISIVLQEPFLYSASIGGNLQVGRTGATQDEIVQAATDACIHDAILKFPRGYKSQVGERGVTLSGGQRQRIALARALLKKPPILILDDALSAVDTDTESRILKTLKEKRGIQTTIIIAHRLSTVMHADNILILDAGRIVQQGTHKNLSQQPGTYRNLCSIQGNIQQQLEQDVDNSNEVVDV